MDVPSVFSSSSSSSFRRRKLAQLNFIKRTPSYGHSRESLSVLERHGWPITVVLGKYDIVHTPQQARWRRKAPQARIRTEASTHWWLCLNADSLCLEDDPMWTA